MMRVSAIVGSLRRGIGSASDEPVVERPRNADAERQASRPTPGRHHPRPTRSGMARLTPPEPRSCRARGGPARTDAVGRLEPTVPSLLALGDGPTSQNPRARSQARRSAASAGSSPRSLIRNHPVTTSASLPGSTACCVLTPPCSRTPRGHPSSHQATTSRRRGRMDWRARPFSVHAVTPADPSTGRSHGSGSEGALAHDARIAVAGRPRSYSTVAVDPGACPSHPSIATLLRRSASLLSSRGTWPTV